MPNRTDIRRHGLDTLYIAADDDRKAFAGKERLDGSDIGPESAKRHGPASIRTMATRDGRHCGQKNRSRRIIIAIVIVLT